MPVKCSYVWLSGLSNLLKVAKKVNTARILNQLRSLNIEIVLLPKDNAVIPTQCWENTTCVIELAAK